MSPMESGKREMMCFAKIVMGDGTDDADCRCAPITVRVLLFSPSSSGGTKVEADVALLALKAGNIVRVAWVKACCCDMVGRDRR